MKYKYLFGSIVVVFIWFLISLRMDNDSVCATMIFYPPCVIFIMLCYIIGLLKDMKSKPKSKENHEKDDKNTNS